MKKPPWDKKKAKEMILACQPTIRDFCIRNGLGATNTFRTSLNRGRFSREMAEKIASGLKTPLHQLVTRLGATILTVKNKTREIN